RRDSGYRARSLRSCSHHARRRLPEDQKRQNGPPVYLALRQIYPGQIANAVRDRICCCVPFGKGNERKSSRFFLMSGTPGPGQSVPNNVLSAISSNRGKYLSNAIGGMPLMSRNTLGWRRTRKNAVCIQSGRPPWASRIFSLGKSTATSSM